MNPQKINHAKQYSFARMVHLIYRLESIDGDNIKNLDFKDEPIRFLANPCLGFPSSDIQSLKINLELKHFHKYELEVNFLGLHGVDSPLPGYYLEEISQLSPEDAVQRNFLDFFNHRSISMLYKIWRKYRFSFCYEEGASDEYSSRIYSFLGFFEKELRVNQGHNINWNKLLGYSGFLASNNRSPEVVAGVIAHNFDLSIDKVKVSIDSFVYRRVKIPNQQLWSLGISNTVLASDAIAGENIADRGGKFRINFFNIGFTRFKDFLPINKGYKGLVKLIEILLRDQFAYEINLYLKADEAPSMLLGRNPDVRLGWSSYVGSCKNESMLPVVFQVRM